MKFCDWGEIRCLGIQKVNKWAISIINTVDIEDENPSPAWYKITNTLQFLFDVDTLNRLLDHGGFVFLETEEQLLLLHELFINNPNSGYDHFIYTPNGELHPLYNISNKNLH